MARRRSIGDRTHAFLAGLTNKPTRVLLDKIGLLDTSIGTPKRLLLIAALLVVPMIFFIAQRVIGDTEQRIIERESLKTAEVVAQHALATRQVYAVDVYPSLVAHGWIAATDGKSRFPAAPDEFLNTVGEESSRFSTDAYTYRWIPIHPTDQESRDPFQQWALSELETQAATKADGAHDWRPVWRLEVLEGVRTLRYMRAAPGPASGCAGCSFANLQPGRTKDGPVANGAVADAGLLPTAHFAGAIEVLVPVEQVAVFAAAQARGTQNLVIGVGVFGLYLLTVIAIRAARHQRGLARQFEQLAKVDTLTGLSNRLSIEQCMQDRLGMAARAKLGLGVMFIDVDDFKNINDSLGHSAGDHVLQEVARRLKGALRDTDLLARYSGDEFVVITSNISDARHLAPIAAKLMESVSAVLSVINNDIFVTVSIGIAYYPSDGQDAPTLLKHADSAMYRAKENGRNHFQFFAADMNAAALEKLQMSSNLRHALHRNEFVLHYQPRADALTGQIIGFEALVRWNHPEHGLMLPGRFIPHAENSGAIEPLGEWVLRAALSQTRVWREDGKFSGTMSVNLSMRQLYNAALPSIVRRALADNGISPKQLELEVTESMVSLDPERAALTLVEISQMGVSIAIDDFGTGQSSLAYLMRFPIGTIKIDRSFTVGLPHCESAGSIIRAILSLAKSLRMRVVAEGVENTGQLEFLKAEGCDEVQGFLIGEPLPAEEVRRLICADVERSERATQPESARMCDTCNVIDCLAHIGPSI